MGPVRGSYKKRKKTEKKFEQNGSTSEEKEESLDWWDEFSKRITGLPSTSKSKDKFESIFKISRRTFNYIYSLVKEDMSSRPGNFSFSNGKSLSVMDQVAIALRRLSSGESLLAIGDSIGLHHSVVSQVTWRFVEVMEERGVHHLHWPSTEEEMDEIKSGFENIRGLPNCCGAIDTTHIIMLMPSAEPTKKAWLDREKKYSMILQAIVDHSMRFRSIVAGLPGQMNDSSALQNSVFFQLCENGEMLNGKSVMLSEGSELREYIVGDASFPLLPWLVTPYQGKDLPEHKAEFNKQQFATRMVAQRALNRLKEMWKIIQGVMWRPDRTRMPTFIFVCCLLHNIVIDLEDDVQMDCPVSNHHDSIYRPLVCDFADKNASIQRDKLSLYLSGKLPP